VFGQSIGVSFLEKMGWTKRDGEYNWSDTHFEGDIHFKRQKANPEALKLVQIRSHSQYTTWRRDSTALHIAGSFPTIISRLLFQIRLSWLRQIQ
jgi:hypothetical protein